MISVAEKPTNHVVYGEGMAILAGDGLLTYAFEPMARQTHIALAKLAAIISTFALCSRTGGNGWRPGL